MPALPAADIALALATVGEAWEGLRGGRVFVTGGTGFFGRWVLETFVAANEARNLGAEAVVLTRDPAALAARAPHLESHPALEFHRGDVRDFAFPGGKFTHVIHAATEASARLNVENPGEMASTIVDGTRRILAFASAAQARRLLFVSSGAVYGHQPSDLTHIPEDYAGAPDPLDPASAYGEGKRMAELLCAAAGRMGSVEVSIARCFAFLGPLLPLDAHFAVGNFIRDALAGGPVRVGGDGSPLRSYLYAADLAAWLWTLLLRAPGGRAYNVGSGAAVSIAALAHAVRDAVAPEAEVEIALSPAPGHFPARYVPSVDRIAEELGLRPQIGLAEAIARTASWNRRT